MFATEITPTTPAAQLNITQYRRRMKYLPGNIRLQENTTAHSTRQTFGNLLVQH
jgi:hypothetical protein